MTVFEVTNRIYHIAIYNGSDLATRFEYETSIQVAVRLGILDLDTDAWLSDISVTGSDEKPEYRGQGIGSKALMIQEKNLKKLGCRRIVGLFTPEEGHFEDLLDWYESMGYIFFNMGIILIYKDL